MKDTNVHFSARLPTRVARMLKEYSRRHRQSASSAAVQILEEGLRMERFPGIDFRWTPTGRKAHVTGTGLAVWELQLIWVDHDRNIERVREHYPHLTGAQIRSAAAYAETFPDEAPELGPPSFARHVRV